MINEEDGSKTIYIIMPFYKVHLAITHKQVEADWQIMIIIEW
jgi:hypothetical protein